MENEHMDVQHAVINAQKGDCSIINFGSCLIIYDFGLKESFNSIRIRLEHILAFLILSHDHDDHKCALLDVINYLRWRPHAPKLFFISPLSRKSALRRYGKMNVIGDRTNFGRKEITVQFSNENIKLQVVYPTHEKLLPKDYNWNSLVTAITVNGQIILLTGDQYFSFIHSAMNVLGITKTTVFQFSHHGSAENFNQRNSYVPSTYYIISGTPLPDRNNAGSDVYRRHTSYQNSIAHLLCQHEMNIRIVFYS
jgi:hypothetical protein